MTARKIGVHGASRIGNSDGPVRYRRQVLRSRSVRTLGTLRLSSPVTIPASSSSPPSRASSHSLTATSTRPRIRSSADRVARATPAINVSSNKVSTLRLSNTRSNSCNMYTALVSISTLIAALNTAIATNAARQALIAAASSGCRESLIGAVSGGGMIVSLGRPDDHTRRERLRLQVP